MDNKTIPAVAKAAALHMGEWVLIFQRTSDVVNRFT